MRMRACKCAAILIGGRGYIELNMQEIKLHLTVTVNVTGFVL